MSSPFPTDLPAADSPDLFGSRQDWTDERAAAKATRAAEARKASGRRRLIDPTTCDRDYSLAEKEFMDAIEAYKLSSGRKFPTWSEVLEVFRGLGYERPTDGATGLHLAS